MATKNSTKTADNGNDVPDAIKDRISGKILEKQLETPGVKKQKTMTITPPRNEELAVIIRGTAPYCQNRFSQKAMEQIKEKQMAGSSANKGKNRDPKDFQACFEGAKHYSKEGWLGIPAPAFRNAMISACRLVGFKMTIAKMSVFIGADGFDKVDFTPLVKITKGLPEYTEMPVRPEMGGMDIRPRPMWQPGWEAIVRIRYDADQFSSDDVLNLLKRVGEQVGVGEGRPDSPNSTGMGWGLFDIVGLADK